MYGRGTSRGRGGWRGRGSSGAGGGGRGRGGSGGRGDGRGWRGRGSGGGAGGESSSSRGGGDGGGWRGGNSSGWRSTFGYSGGNNAERWDRNNEEDRAPDQEVANDPATEERRVRPRITPKETTPPIHFEPTKLNPTASSETEEEEPEKPLEKILVLHTPKAGMIAAAYYDPETMILHVMDDTKDTDEFDLACLIMEQVDPQIVVCSSRVKVKLIEVIEQYCSRNEATFEQQTPKFFTPSHAISQLTLLNLPDGMTSAAYAHHRSAGSHGYEGSEEDEWTKYGLPEDNGAGMGRRRMAVVKLGAWMNPHAIGAVCAAGGLMWYLNKHSSMRDDKDFDVNRLRGIETLTLDQYMLINNDALTSLAIFGEEAHGFMHSGKQKEGLSLFGLLDECATPFGRKLLRLWHLRPLLDLRKISARHDAVELFASPEHRFEADVITGAMKKIGNIAATIRALRRGKQKLNAFRAVAETLTHTLSVAHEVASLPGPALEVTERVRRAVAPEIQLITREIIETMDWDDSKTEGRICIRPGIDEDLDRIKDEYAGHSALLTKVSRKIFANLPSIQNIASLNVSYFPQICHVIGVQYQDKEEHGVPPDWERAFMHEDTYFYRNSQMVALNSHYGDILNLIIDRGADHAQALIEKIRPMEPMLIKAVEAIGELDCVLALARAANTYKLVRPKMTAKPILSIRNGRHILQELCVEQYVPNDTKISGGASEDLCSMMIVTGANGSGKSAYGKQVALIVFMAQIGSFVPADMALVGVVDKIYTRLQTKESVSKAASAFMIDLTQVSLALRGVTERSLIIMDEFGKGTTPSDGAGLLAGVIKYLLDTTCPRTIVLTHFHELFTAQILGDDMPVLFCHMKTMPIPGDERIAYLYRLSPTLSMTSNAAECALAHGIPADIVARARFVTDCIMNHQWDRLLDTRLTPEENAELQRAEDLTRRFLMWKIDPEQEDVMDKLRELLEETMEEASILELQDDEAGSVAQAGQRIDPRAAKMFGSAALEWETSDGVETDQQPASALGYDPAGLDSGGYSSYDANEAAQDGQVWEHPPAPADVKPFGLSPIQERGETDYSSDQYNDDASTLTAWEQPGESAYQARFQSFGYDQVDAVEEVLSAPDGQSTTPHGDQYYTAGSKTDIDRKPFAFAQHNNNGETDELWGDDPRYDGGGDAFGFDAQDWGSETNASERPAYVQADPVYIDLTDE